MWNAHISIQKIKYGSKRKLPVKDESSYKTDNKGDKNLKGGTSTERGAE
tara:strand:- start:40 stop:186 length:147 start_codon:yes stop_codon:yes gene_type:complete